MAKVTLPQEVPAEWQEKYLASLQAANAVTGSTRSRYPWKLNWTSNKYGVPTAAQRAHRSEFSKCVRCYNAQAIQGSPYPPGTGPFDREYWFSEAAGSGLWYYDYFIQQTINTYLAGNKPQWCTKNATKDAYVSSGNPDTNYGARTYVQATHPDSNPSGCFTDKPFEAFNYYTIRLIEIGQWGPPPKIGITINIYDVWDTFNENTITWNNKPLLGDLISTVHIPYAVSSTIIPIFAPSYAPTIFIEVASGAWFIRWQSSNNAQEYKRPYFAA